MQFDTMNMNQLVKQYNEIADQVGKPHVEGFETKKDGVAKIKALLKKAPTKKASAKTKTKTKTKGKVKTAPRKSGSTAGKGKGAQLNFPAQKTIKPAREGSFRAALRDELLKGSGKTLRELEAFGQKFYEKRQKATGKTPPENVELNTYQATRFLAVQNGYGLTTDPNTGKITLQE